MYLKGCALSSLAVYETPLYNLEIDQESEENRDLCYNMPQPVGTVANLAMTFCLAFVFWYQVSVVSIIKHGSRLLCSVWLTNVQ